MYNPKNKKMEMQRRRKISEKLTGGHLSEERKQKMRETSLRLGLRPPNWNKGLTKETDERVRKHAEKRIGRKTSFETRKKMSDSHKRGEEHHKWKGGINPINDSLRKSSIYKIWRELVFLKNNFTCQNPNCEFCHNKIGGYLHAHHVKSFAEFPELRFNINNGITYCKEFHSKIHTKLIMESRI